MDCDGLLLAIKIREEYLPLGEPHFQILLNIVSLCILVVPVKHISIGVFEG